MATPNVSFLEVTPGQAPADYLTTWATTNVNRVWRLVAPGSNANLPANQERRLLVVDATRSSADAAIVVTPTANPSDTAYHFFVPAGTERTLECPKHIHRGAVSVAVTVATGIAVVVTEYSY